MISRGIKQGAGRANIREKKRISGGLKQGVWRAYLRKKEKANGLVGAKNRGGGGGRANLR